MSWSLSEIESLCLKAARGAGLSWGMAQEAGKAARWLAAAGFGGPEALARHLEQIDAAEPGSFAPVITGDTWQGARGMLCPIMAGCALSDLGCSAPIRLQNVSEPLLLLPFAVQAATVPMVLSWPGGQFACGGALHGALHRALHGESHGAALRPGAPADVEFRPGTAPGQPALDCALRYAPQSASVSVLERFAHRTYAPDTDASRTGGAGAGLSDND